MQNITEDADLLVRQIRAGSAERKNAVKQLVNNQKLKNKVVSYVTRNSGDKTDGETMFHDAIVTMIKTVFSKPGYVITSHPHAYILGVAKHLWMNELRKKGRHSSTSLDVVAEPISDDNSLSLMMTRDTRRIISAVLDQMAKNCKQVLMLWSGGYKMTEIAAALEYSSEGMARKKKSNCMKELYAYLQEHPHIVERIRPI